MVDELTQESFQTGKAIVTVSVDLIQTIAEACRKSEQNKTLNPEQKENVLKTFTDYSDEVPVQFIRFTIPKGHKWAGLQLKDISMPPETIFVLLRRDGENITPTGNTMIMEGDCLVLSAKTPEEIEGIELREIIVGDEDTDYVGKKLSEISKEDEGLVIMIQRGDDVIIPHGDVVIKAGDVLVIDEV